MDAMVIRQKFQLAALGAVFGAAFLLISAADAGEKVQIKASTAIELPKPKHTLEEMKSLRGAEAPNGRSVYEGGVAAGTPVYNNSSPLMDKKLKEMLDKKKNWIFVNPYEMQFDSKTAEFMEGEKATGLFDHRLMQDEEKTVLEKFVDEKNPDREGDLDEKEREPDFAARKEMLGLRGGADDLEEDPSKRGTDKTETLQFKLEQKASFTSERSPFLQKLERTPFAEGGLSDKFSEDRTTVSKEDLRKDREVRDAEFGKLFQARSFDAPAAGGFDPLKNAPDASRQEINPLAPRRSDPFINIGRSEPKGVGIAAGRNSPIFSGASPSASLPGRSSSDLFGPKVAQPSALAPSSTFTPPAPPRPSVNTTPFVLPTPQRKF
jgi:hypothetical protein